MKSLCTFILLLFTVAFYAQDKSNDQIIQTIKDGTVSFKKTPIKPKLKVKQGNSTASINTIDYLPNESFETWLPIGWEVYNEGNGGWNQNNSEAYSGSSSALSIGAPFSDSWLISPAIDLSTATSAFLTYFEKIVDGGGNGENDYPEIMIATDYAPGMEYYWATWYSLPGMDEFTPHPWEKKEWDLTDFLGETIYIAFYYYNDGNEELIPGYDWFIDDLSVTSDGSTECIGDYTIPDCTSLYSPPDGALNMQLNVPISWQTTVLENVTKQLLYVGTDGGGISTPTNIENGTEQFPLTSGITLTNLSPNTSYYWQVVPANCAYEAQGCPIWSFTTGDGNVHFGGGSTNQGGYLFANSTSNAASAPYKPTYNWVDISSSGTDIISTIGNDETLGPFNIGFNFEFFGNTYNQFYVNSNGFITFENVSGQTNFPHPIPSANGINNLIAGYYMDLDPTNPNVSDKHIFYGNNNGDLVITFEKIPQIYWDGFQYAEADADGWITFQIILQQNENVKIQFKEKGSSFIVYDFYTGEVGIENLDGTQGVLYRRSYYGGPIFDGSLPLAVEFYKPGLVNANIELSVFLEGPYNSGMMNYSSNSNLLLTQPYNIAPWSYAGTEITTANFISDNNIVDWIYIELRSGTSVSTATDVVSKRAALLRNDGVILDIDGSTDIDFGSVSAGDYYIAIFHRNHLPILSTFPVTF